MTDTLLWLAVAGLGLVFVLTALAYGVVRDELHTARRNAELTRADERERREVERNRVYAERDKLVAALAHVFPAGLREDADASGWPIVYVDLPSGQASWHIQRDELPWFADLPPYRGEWDGHTSEEKYERLAALRRPPLTPEQRSQLMANLCAHCGGSHAIACPRVKSIRFRADGQTPVAVEFFPDGEWPKDRVVWPEDLVMMTPAQLTVVNG